jgi:hypothetical protein
MRHGLNPKDIGELSKVPPDDVVLSAVGAEFVLRPDMALTMVGTCPHDEGTESLTWFPLPPSTLHPIVRLSPEGKASGEQFELLSSHHAIFAEQHSQDAGHCAFGDDDQADVSVGNGRENAQRFAQLIEKDPALRVASTCGASEKRGMKRIGAPDQGSSSGRCRDIRAGDSSSRGMSDPVDISTFTGRGLGRANNSPGGSS